MLGDPNDAKRPDGTNRRQFLTALGAVGVVGLAGCGGDGDGTDSPTETEGDGTASPTGTDGDETDSPTGTDDDETDVPTETDATETETDGDVTETDDETGTPNQDFPPDPPTVVTFDGGGSVQPGETTTLTATVQNPYLFPLQSVQISLEAPGEDWTVTANGETDLGTIAEGDSTEVSWEITAPDGASGQFAISGSVSYASETDAAESTLSQSIAVLDLGGVPTDGVEAYFPYDGDTAINQVTGTEAAVTGEPTTDATGFVDGAWEFTTSGDPPGGRSETTDAVTSGETLPLNDETATVGAWVNFTDHEAYGRLYQVGGSVAEPAAAAGGHEVIFHGGTDPANDLLVADGTGRVVGGDGAFPDLATETWYFVVIVRDGANYRLHAFDENGELDSSPATGSHDSPPPTSSSEPLVMMSGDDSETAGRIDEVYGYSRALSEPEVTELYDGAGGST